MLSLRGIFAPVLGKWGRPSPVFNPDTGKYETGGMVWYGNEPVDAEDEARLYERHNGIKVKIDPYARVGRKSRAPKWTTWSTVKRREWKARIKL